METNEVGIVIGERLCDLRKDANMTQKELADILKVTKSSISAYEKDISEPPDVIKIQIAKLFDVSLDYLAGLTNKPYVEKEKANYIRVAHDIPQELIPFIQDFADYIVRRHQSK